MGQIDIHVYGGNRVLETVAPIKHRNGVLQILYTNFVDRNAAVIAFILNIFDIQQVLIHMMPAILIDILFSRLAQSGT
jgi:hypothetical protein